MCDVKTDCRCFEAMEVSYKTLRDKKYSEPRAFDIAVSIYRYYHPDDSLAYAREQTAELLEDLAVQ